MLHQTKLTSTRVFLFLLLAIIATYAAIFSLDVMFGDDIIRIYDNKKFDTILDILTHNLFDRPFLMFTLLLEKNFLALNPVVQRLSNLTQLAVCGLILFKTCNILQKIHLGQEKPTYSLILALLFSLHPLHHQLIALIIQRGVILSIAFGLLTFLYLIKWSTTNDRKFLIFSIFFYLLGILSKPNIFFIPLFSFFYISKNFKTKKAIILPLIPFIFISVVPILIYFGTGVNKQKISLPPMDYFMTQMEVVFDYITKFFLPFNYQFLYDYELSLPKFFLYFFAHALIIFLSKKFIFTTRNSFLLFCGMYFSFLPESSIFPIFHVAFDHRANFPLLFIFLALSIAPKPDWLPAQYKNFKLEPIFLASVFCYFIFFNIIRTGHYIPVEKFRDRISQSSHSYITNNVDAILELISVRELQNAKRVNQIKIEHVQAGYKAYHLMLAQIINDYLEKKNPVLFRETVSHRIQLLLNQQISYFSSKIVSFLFMEMKGELSKKNYCSFVNNTLTPTLSIIFQNKNFYQFIPSYQKSLICDLHYLSFQKALTDDESLRFIRSQIILKYYYRVNIQINNELFERVKIKFKENKEFIRCQEILNSAGASIPPLPSPAEIEENS